MVDVSGILARCGEENCHYDPVQRFDFKLDTTLDKQVLLPLLPKRENRLFQSAAPLIFPVLTVRSERSSARRSRAVGAVRWRMILIRFTAAAALGSHSVRFCRRA